jgi:hypothetical protein
MTGPHPIVLSPRARSCLSPTLLDIVEALLPVRFVDEPPSGRPRAVLRVGAAAANSPADTAVSRDGLELRVPATRARGDSVELELDIRFADDAEVPFPFRDRGVSATVGNPFEPLRPEPGERVLATSSLGVLWTVRTEGPVARFRSALPLPAVAEDEGFVDLFSGRRFLHLLPLLHFLEGALGVDRFERPPLRASFVVDDPNLHWPRYGCIAYPELARRAARENYHVSMAMIPIDTWFTHPAAADLFRRDPERLSLLVHGNNHASKELARPYSDAERFALLRQARQRIERFERRSGLHVCRVMVPPHGACSADMLAALVRSGFDAACISSGSLRAHNPTSPWVRTLGFAPCEVIRGCPVLPRWAVGGEVKHHLLLAAYLGQPLIARAHHRDLKGGPDTFDELARFINGMGVVEWRRPDELCRRSYRWLRQGTLLRVTPFARAIELDLPAGVAAVVVDSPEEAPGFGPWRAELGDGSTHDLLPGQPMLLAPTSRARIALERACMPPPTSAPTRVARTSPRLVLRRVLTEARDRLMLG